MIVRNYKSGDIFNLVPQKAQLDDYYWLSSRPDSLYDAVVVEREGKVLMICGRRQIWEGRNMMWAVLSEEAGQFMVGLTKKAKLIIDLLNEDCNRIEMTVLEDFEQGHRWAKILGFSPEGVLKCYTPNGENVMMYSKVS